MLSLSSCLQDVLPDGHSVRHQPLPLTVMAMMLRQLPEPHRIHLQCVSRTPGQGISNVERVVNAFRVTTEGKRGYRQNCIQPLRTSSRIISGRMITAAYPLSLFPASLPRKSITKPGCRASCCPCAHARLLQSARPKRQNGNDSITTQVVKKARCKLLRRAKTQRRGGKGGADAAEREPCSERNAGARLCRIVLVAGEARGLCLSEHTERGVRVFADMPMTGVFPAAARFPLYIGSGCAMLCMDTARGPDAMDEP